jgi:hypothetical protein
MLHAGLDLSRRRLDYCLLAPDGRALETGAGAPDADGLDRFARRIERRWGPMAEVRAAIESMTGARFVHDTLERCGWEVEVADAIKVKGLAPLACKTDRIDAWVLAELSRRELVPAIWAARLRGASGARARALAVASGQAPLTAQAPCARGADAVRASVPGQRPVRQQGPRAA